MGDLVGPSGDWVGPRGDWVGPRGDWVGPRGDWVGPRGDWVGPRARLNVWKRIKTQYLISAGITQGIDLHIQECYPSSGTQKLSTF
jgi:hypothetical protein